ncbi:hypothetical protein P7228_03035 [Altererythrobacter arenosus]|uniref:Uncharacterized protein n=1 Tax=Altererythrobacter arenosus TaxID=3032592 RepID=A0ABY8FSS4_9SPHN|nr:hypothetical protein [Altererythrobacter sp. CAU 1644]WFL78059.1 hypothetical protein P7228_03035 [Altererythrobacter sp. CAU 1644]
MKAVLRGILVLGAVQIALPVAAEERDLPEVASPDVVEKLFQCRTIEDPTDRLACFDRQVAEVYQAKESKDLVIADREQMRETRKGLFGFSLPKIGLFGGGDDKEDEIKEISSQLARVGRASNGRLTFTVAGGARWIQTDNVPVLGEPKEGDEVTIESAALGSYMAKIGKRRPFRVRRVD